MLDINSADRRILERGRLYLKKGAVGELARFGDMIDARVLGSRPSPYRVRVKLGEDGYPLAAWCDCPFKNTYYSYCKHVYAVLLKYFSLNHNLIGQDKNPIVKDRSSFRSESVLELLADELGDTQRAHGIIRELEALNCLAGPKSTKDGKRYRLAFVIEDKQARYYSQSNGLSLTPLLQYLKLNGDAGRFEKFREDKITEDISKEEFFLLRRMVEKIDHDGYGRWHDVKHIPVFNVLEYLLKNNFKNVFVKKGGYRPVTFCEIGYVDVSFRIAGLSHDKKAFFNPIITLVGTNNIKAEVLRTGALEFDGLSMLYSHDEFLFYLFNGELISSFVKEIAGGREWSFSDIKKIFGYFQKNKTDKINIKFDFERIKTIYPVPKPFLNMAERRSWNGDYAVSADVMFDYHGKEVNPSERAEFLILGEKDKEILLARRNREYERKICDYIGDLSCFAKSGYGYNAVSTFSAPLALRDFLAKYGSDIVEKGVELRIFGQKERLSASGTISLKADYQIDWFDLKAEYKDGAGNAGDIKIDPSLLANGVVYAGGRLVIINKENISKLERFIKCGMSENGRLRVPKYNFHLIDELYGDIAEKTGALNELKKLGERLREFKTIKKHLLPKGFNGNLRDYQQAGYNWLHFLNEYNLSGCLADDMGLGKTVQTLAFLQSLKEEKRLALSVAVVPVNVIANWENEIKAFSPELKYLVHAGADRNKDAEFLKGHDLIVVSYQTLKNDIDLFNKLEFDYVILDESQNIKNFNTLSCKAIKKLKSGHRLSLTGTPVENNTLELWSQMDFLVPGLLGDHREFKRNFANPIESSKDEAAALRLKKIVFPFMLRRKKEDVAKDLPEKSEITLCTEMDDRQAKIYQNTKEFYKQQVTNAIDKDGLNRSAIIVLAALLKLRQIAILPSLASEKYAGTPSCKFDLLKDTLDEILSEDHKVVVFSQFVEALKVIKNHLDSRKMMYSYIDGGVNAAARNKEIEKFQNGDKVKLFLLSLKAGGVGINLTAADYVILFDPWWNPAVEMQAADRVHRIGQTKKVVVYKMITKDTVEEKILELQRHKSELVKNLVSVEKGFFKDLSRDDVIHLFE